MLLHGIFGSCDNLGVISRALVDHYETHSLDLRNHGNSPHCEKMDYPLMAKDVVALMDKLKIEQTHLLGHSMGGKVAMQLALNYPQRVNKLIVSDISPVGYQARHDNVLEGLFAIDLKAVSSIRDADNQLAKWVEEPAVRGFLLKNLKRDEQKNYYWRLNLEAIKSNYAPLAAGVEGTPFNGPTLFVKGENSAYIQEKHHDKIQHLFPNSRVEVIAGAGHWLHADKPQEFNQLVLSFLQE